MYRYSYLIIKQYQTPQTSQFSNPFPTQVSSDQCCSQPGRSGASWRQNPKLPSLVATCFFFGSGDVQMSLNFRRKSLELCQLSISFLYCNSTIIMSTSKMFASSAGSSGSSGTSRSCCSVSGNCSSWLAAPRGQQKKVLWHAIHTLRDWSTANAESQLYVNQSLTYLRYLWIYRA